MKLSQQLLIALLLALPASLEAQFIYVTNNSAITIIVYTGPGGPVDIPDQINGLPVVAIGGGAFYEKALTSVTIPNSVSSIGDSAFAYCNGLINVTIGISVTTIGDSAFAGDGLTHVTIPNSVTNIGDSAFAYCYNLTKLTIGNSVGTIGNSAFFETDLMSVTIPNSVTDIGDSTFGGCSSLTNAAIGTNVATIGNSAFDSDGLTSVTIPNSVTDIGDSAFAGCPLTSVVIPGSVTNIGTAAFAAGQGEILYLTSITVAAQNSSYSSLNGVLFDKNQTILIQFAGALAGSYTIPNSVTCIADSAFEGASALTNITIGTNVATIGNSAFYGDGLTSVTIPNSVIAIGDSAFESCSSLTNVTIGNSVGTIGDSAFRDCPLTSVIIPDSVANIGTRAFCADAFISFASLTAITVAAQNPSYSSLNGVLFDKNQTTLIQFPAGLGGSYRVPDGVTSIGDSAFENCPSLTDVTVGNSVSSIGVLAFAQCTALTNIYFMGNAPNADPSAFVAAWCFDGCHGYDHATAYYLPGTLGWSDNLAGIPTALWFLPQPLILTQDLGFGVQSNQFGFTISWATNVPVVVEGATNLANPVWLPLATNVLSGGSFHFTDADWSKYPNRFYRVRSP